MDICENIIKIRKSSNDFLIISQMFPVENFIILVLMLWELETKLWELYLSLVQVVYHYCLSFLMFSWNFILDISWIICSLREIWHFCVFD